MPGVAEGREVGQTADVVDIPLEIDFISRALCQFSKANMVRQ